MVQTINKSKATQMVALLLMFLFAGSGCSYFKDKAYYDINLETLKGDKYTGASVGSASDADVIKFMTHIKTALRMHMKWSRVARIVSASAQVLTAAAATAMVGLSYGSQEVIGVLAGTSAIIPNLQAIFQAKERAEAYDEGLRLIEEAESDFRKEIVMPDPNDPTSTPGIVNTDKMTVAGAELYTRILASIKLVETALVQQIPSIEQLQVATGEIKQVKLSHAAITLPVADIGNVMLLEGGSIANIISNNKSVVTADVDPKNSKKVVLKGIYAGNAEVVVANRRGSTGAIQVTVTGSVPTKAIEIAKAKVVLAEKNLNKANKEANAAANALLAATEKDKSAKEALDKAEAITDPKIKDDAVAKAKADADAAAKTLDAATIKDKSAKEAKTAAEEALQLANAAKTAAEEADEAIDKIEAAEEAAQEADNAIDAAETAAKKVK